jgi:hypothetical protein
MQYHWQCHEPPPESVYHYKTKENSNLKQESNMYLHHGTVQKDLHPDPSVSWHHQVFYPCHSSEHVYGGHSNPKCIPVKKITK